MVIDEDRGVDSSASAGYMHHIPPSQHSLPEGPSAAHDSRNNSPRVSIQSSDQVAPDSVFSGRSPKPAPSSDVCGSQADSSLYSHYMDNKGNATSSSGNNSSSSPGAASNSTQPYSHPVSSSQRSRSPEDESSLMSPHVSSNANEGDGSPVLSSQYETLSDDD